MDYQDTFTEDVLSQIESLLEEKYLILQDLKNKKSLLNTYYFDKDLYQKYIDIMSSDPTIKLESSNSKFVIGRNDPEYVDFKNFIITALENEIAIRNLKIDEVLSNE